MSSKWPIVFPHRPTSSSSFLILPIERGQYSRQETRSSGWMKFPPPSSTIWSGGGDCAYKDFIFPFLVKENRQWLCCVVLCLFIELFIFLRLFVLPLFLLLRLLRFLLSFYFFARELSDRAAYTTIDLGAVSDDLLSVAESGTHDMFPLYFVPLYFYLSEKKRRTAEKVKDVQTWQLRT